ncbi:MAG TPA: hypothetical protein VFL04_08610 [Rectinemataceae bacterium]|nr:hypothetical protein [Rectinemataceae bacterium]
MRPNQYSSEKRRKELEKKKKKEEKALRKAEQKNHPEGEAGAEGQIQTGEGDPSGAADGQGEAGKASDA